LYSCIDRLPFASGIAETLGVCILVILIDWGGITTLGTFEKDKATHALLLSDETQLHLLDTNTNS